MDAQVLAVQQWLNATYGNRSGWVTLDEDGMTGWATIYGLRRGLQAELGISPLSSGFGPATTAAYRAQIGSITDDSVGENVLRLLSGALWCKGYPAVWADFGDVSLGVMTPSITAIKEDLGLSNNSVAVDVKLMASLLTMDAYRRVRAGEDAVREAQRWLNSAFAQRRDFALIPTDGVYSRQIQTALLYGLQYEIGMADGTANGNFGPGTRDGIRTKATVGPGSVDGASRFVRLFQCALRFNGFEVPLSGSFGGATEVAARSFQSFMELTSTARGDYSTWCFLLVSSGDTTVSTSGFDTRTQLSGAEASRAHTLGYRVVGRYTVGAGKYLTAAELRGLRDAGLALVPIHQRFNNSPDVMTRANGVLHGTEAVARCRVLGLPEDTIIFFPVDFDALGETISGPVIEYFRGVKESVGHSLARHYKIGVYGTRNVCSTVIGKGLADAAYIAGISTGWSGNMGFRMPEAWHYNQIVELPNGSLGPRAIPIDKVIVSSRATPVDLSSVVPPPIERDGSTSATGFDAFYEWFISARVACERSLSESSSALNPMEAFVGGVDDHITHWLRKSDYWTALWKAYTPVIETERFMIRARLTSQSALDEFTSTTPLVSTRDIAHFAATLRGYEVWGVPTTPADYNLGDLGGWALDLLQIWGTFARAQADGRASSLDDYLAANLGGRSAEAASAGFGWEDVVADADAFLVAKAAGDGHGGLESALRHVLQADSPGRLRTFFGARFTGRTSNIVTAFGRLVDGIDVWNIPNVPYTKQMLMSAANADSLPDARQTRVLAESFGRVLTGG